MATKKELFLFLVLGSQFPPHPHLCQGQLPSLCTPPPGSGTNPSSRRGLWVLRPVQ